MDNSGKGETPGSNQSSSRVSMVGKEDQLSKPRQVGLHCEETWELQGSYPYHSQSSEVCYEGERVCDPQHRCCKLSQIEKVEEGIFLRTGSTVHSKRAEFRRIGRGSSCPSPAALKEAAGLPTISEKKEEEVSWIEADSMDSYSDPEFASGFSDDGELDEQEPWFPEDEAFQGQATVDIWEDESWKDIFSHHFKKVL